MGRLGHATKLKWNAPGEWIWSQEPVHEPLIGTGVFEQVQRGFNERVVMQSLAWPLVSCGLACNLTALLLSLGMTHARHVSGVNALRPVTRLPALRRSIKERVYLR